MLHNAHDISTLPLYRHQKLRLSPAAQFFLSVADVPTIGSRESLPMSIIASSQRLPVPVSITANRQGLQMPQNAQAISTLPSGKQIHSRHNNVRLSGGGAHAFLSSEDLTMANTIKEYLSHITVWVRDGGRSMDIMNRTESRTEIRSRLALSCDGSVDLGF